MIGKITLFFLFLLLIWGNLVSGLGAGLGCPDWPLCHGSVVPPYRWDIYMEYTHRVIGGVTSIFLVYLSYKRLRSYDGWTKLIPVLIVCLLAFQIVLGGIVVLLEIPVDLTTFHFANALVIFSLTLYIVFFDGENVKPIFTLSGHNGVFFFLAILIFFQAVLGAYVRHSNAGLACPDFPKCLGYWIPPELSGMVLNHFVHRVAAYVLTLIVLGFFISTWFVDGFRRYRAAFGIALGLIVIQIILGVGIIHTKLHFAAAALHLSVALLILSLFLYTWFLGMRRIYAGSNRA